MLALAQLPSPPPSATLPDAAWQSLYDWMQGHWMNAIPHREFVEQRDSINIDGVAVLKESQS